MFLTLAVCFLAGPRAAVGQEGAPLSRSLQSLESLKTHIAVLMKENNQLEVQYALLKREYDVLNETYMKYAARLDTLKREREQEARIIDERRSRINELEAQLPDTEANKLVLKSRIAFTNQKLLDMNEQLRLLKLKISDLEFELRDIEMALKVKKYNAKELEQQQQRKLQELRDAYARNMEMEKKLLAEIEHISSQGKTADDKISRIKDESEEMATRIAQIKTKIDMQKKENELLRKKKLYELRLSENKIWQYDQKKLALEESVTGLEKKAEALGAKIELSRNKQMQKREILDTIMRIDQENQNLKDKIFDLQQKIKDIKK